MRSRSSDIQQSLTFRKTGLFFALLCVLYLLLYLASRPFPSPSIHNLPGDATLFLALGIITALFVLSALRSTLNWVQPVLLMAMTPLPMVYAQIPVFSLGVFIAGEILLYRLGFFARWRLPKFGASILYFFLCQAAGGIRAGYSLFDIMVYILFLILFLCFLLIVYGERWIIYLREPKPLLSLSRMGLTRKEVLYLKALLDDKSMKEIALNNSVKESTVRNTLARVYRKFEVWDKSALKAKCAQYSIKD
ncbi:MAG: LuxR C-terminal-related transcriptional regulator [Spirochaetia bacterium]|jgi:DNA-binding CsgD family transcriptional regulator|nr:LuxR C-terminal-related transcriptional regulator [Spirochaetales bacterium]MDX9784194.1 LuxR C-terminal-related transcriptional regulator [Spirochaetia bacterium]